MENIKIHLETDNEKVYDLFDIVGKKAELVIKKEKKYIITEYSVFDIDKYFGFIKEDNDYVLRNNEGFVFCLLEDQYKIIKDVLKETE